MTAVLVFPLASAALVRAHVKPGDLIIGVDGGAEAIREAGLRPARIVGDMDSVTHATLAAFEAAGVPIERHPRSKRDTDGALALAGTKGEFDVLFLGAGGGRADHALANLHLLVAAAAHGAQARGIDADARTWIVTPQRALDLSLPEGATISILPWDASCEGITSDGLHYPLVEATMTAGDPYGVSNVTGRPPQRIRIRKGRLVVIQPVG